MDNIAGTKSGLMWTVHISVVVLVALWLFPTLGLLVSSFRTADQIASSGWWASMFPTEQSIQLRTAPPDAQVQEGALWVIEGNVFAVEGAEPTNAGEISAWGVSARDISAYQPGETADMEEDGRLTVEADGAYRLENDVEFEGRRG
ncbi:MAG: carbohydrate ABC transporter permease, partial [Pseudomonadota bacterium]